MAQVKENFLPNTHLRGEITYRWEQLNRSEIDEGSRDRSKLISFLQNRYGYAPQRAEKEVDLFYLEFQNRLRMTA